VYIYLHKIFRLPSFLRALRNEDRVGPQGAKESFVFRIIPNAEVEERKNASCEKRHEGKAREAGVSRKLALDGKKPRETPPPSLVVSCLLLALLLCLCGALPSFALPLCPRFLVFLPCRFLVFTPSRLLLAGLLRGFAVFGFHLARPSRRQDPLDGKKAKRNPRFRVVWLSLSARRQESQAKPAFFLAFPSSFASRFLVFLPVSRLFREYFASSPTLTSVAFCRGASSCRRFLAVERVAPTPSACSFSCLHFCSAFLSLCLRFLALLSVKAFCRV
jgi:hypothetical protein